MEIVAAAATIGQATGYAISVISSLQDLYSAMKHGRRIFQDEYSSIGHLLNLVKENKTIHTGYFQHLLISIEESAQKLSSLFKQNKRVKVISTLLLQRKEINDTFATLERKKSTLILYFTAKTTSTVAEIQKKLRDNSSNPTYHNLPTVQSSAVNYEPEPFAMPLEKRTSFDYHGIELVDNLIQYPQASSSTQTPPHESMMGAAGFPGIHHSTQDALSNSSEQSSGSHTSGSSSKKALWISAKKKVRNAFIRRPHALSDSDQSSLSSITAPASSAKSTLNRVRPTFITENNHAIEADQDLYGSKTISVIHQDNTAMEGVVLLEDVRKRFVHHQSPHASITGPLNKFFGNHCNGKSTQIINGSATHNVKASMNISSLNSNQHIGMLPGHKSKRTRERAFQELGNH